MKMRHGGGLLWREVEGNLVLLFSTQRLQKVNRRSCHPLRLDGRILALNSVRCCMNDSEIPQTAPMPNADTVRTIFIKRFLLSENHLLTTLCP